MMPQNPELELAWNFVEKTDKNIFLTGKAGTGKTTFLHKIRNESFKRLVVVAPTGVAAINAKGVTIHSFFQMSFGPILPPEAETLSSHQNQHNNSKYQKKFNKKKIDIIRSLDLLIIDEVSMVRADLLDGIDQVLRRYKDKNKVFGGVQLLMIGDLQQLAPVVKNDEWKLLQPYYDTAFFFSSRAFQESQAIGIELKHIYRQSNKHFIEILNEIRNNHLSQASMDSLNERYDPNFNPKPDDGYITLTTHNDRANRMNETELANIERKSHFFHAEIEGTFPEYSYPTHEKLELKMGAQVMFIKNDSSPEKRYFNGKIGKIVQIFKDEIIVRCAGDAEDISTVYETWDNLKYSINEQTKEISEKVQGSFSQMPLRLAWAITIHKSQGLTFEKAIIDAAASFAHGQTYVALSRCKTLEGIVLKSKINRQGIIQDNRVINFTKNVEEHPPTNQHLHQAQNSYQLSLIEEMFSLKQLPYLVNRCQKIVYQSGNTLKGNINDPLKIIKEKGAVELVKVGESFKNQLLHMNSEHGEPENNPQIQERIKKAVAYFIQQMEEFLIKPFSEIVYTTDNKTIEKDFKEQLKKINELFNSKLFCLKGMTDGFNTMNYLELRAKSVLQEVKTKKKAVVNTEITKHPKLFEDLRHLRHILAQDEDVAHYQIFTQKTLFELCERFPVNKQQLKAINGMGKVRVDKYGDDIIDMIKDYLENNDIEISKEEDSSIEEKPRKKKQEKGASQKISLQMFKDGVSIENIAKERGLVFSTIENHLSSFIPTGEIKLEELMNKEKAAVLMKLVKSSKFDGLSDLKSQLGDKFSYVELRMVVEELKRGTERL
jgi:predicted ATPase